MNCDEANALLPALIDGELDAGHASEVEVHAEGCPTCAVALHDLRALRAKFATSRLAYAAPASLRARLDRAIPEPASRRLSGRRDLLRGFALGAAASAIAATAVLMVVPLRNAPPDLVNELVSAHLRSLQGEHAIDVLSSDRHTVKPWFNGRLDVAPPVVDLGADGFTLVGGRLDYIDLKPVPVIVYRRRAHIINLFVLPPSAAGPAAADIRGYNVRRIEAGGFALWAVSDVSPEDLATFDDKLAAALRP